MPVHVSDTTLTYSSTMVGLSTAVVDHKGATEDETFYQNGGYGEFVTTPSWL